MSVKMITIKGGEGNQPILIPFQKFIAHSNIFAQKTFSKEFDDEIDYEHTYAYNSLVQFAKAIREEKPTMDTNNVFGYYALCKEWEVDEQVFQYAKDFLERNEKKLLVSHLLFEIEHQQDSSAQIEQLKNNFPEYIEDPNLTSLPFELLKDVIDFNAVAKDQEIFQKVYCFCLKYLDDHQDIENCSEIFQTLDTSKLSYEDLSRLVGKPHFDRTKLNDSLGRLLTELLHRTVELPLKVDEMREKYQSDLDDMKQREEIAAQRESEAKQLRKELEKETEYVHSLEKQIEDLKNSMFPFIKETKDLHDSFLKEKEDWKREEEERRRKEEEERRRKEEEERKKAEEEKKKLKVNVPIRYPNWSTDSNPGWGGWTASGDGWMWVQSGCNNYSSPCYVTVAGKKNLIIAGSNSGYTYLSLVFPIKSGTNLSYNTSSTTSSSAFYMQFKGSNVVTLPDWSNATLKQWNINYNAECDGWIYADCGSINGTQGYIRMNESYNVWIAYNNNGNFSHGSAFVPIASGDRFNLIHGGLPGVCFFIPGKKDFETGYPDWNKEDRRSWGQKYTADESGWVYAQCCAYCCRGTSTNNTPGYLMVNGIPILIANNNHYSSGYYDNGSVLIPIAKGDNYIAQGGYNNQSISFYPFLK